MIEFIPIGRIFFMLFSDDSINFSASFPVFFCIFPSVCKKICCFFSSGSSVFWDLFRFVGIIFPAFFLCRVRNFSVCFHNFFAFLELFWKKNPLFLFLSSGFQACLSWQSGYFSSFFRGKLRNFSARFDIFCASPEFFQKKNPLFSLSVTQFQTFFPCHRDNFHVFSRVGKEIFLPLFIIFVLFPGLFIGKIHIFWNEFSVRTNIFSLPRGVFPDFFRVIR